MTPRSDSDHSEDGPHNENADLDAFFPTMDLQDEEAAHEAFFESKISQNVSTASEPPPSLSSTPTDELDLLLPTKKLDVLQYIMLHYGFLPPIPIPGSEDPVQTTDWNDCLKTIGLRTSELHSPLLGQTASIVSFVKAVQNPTGNLDSWDLSPGHYGSLDKAALLRSFHRLNDLYVLVPSAHSLERDTTFKFLIALTLSDNALYVFRFLQTDSHSVSSLATHLVERGIQFATLLNLDPRPSSVSLSGISVVIPQRLPNYVFKPSDYEVYVQQRAQLLSSPRGRAALLHGGIVSRIAREHLAPDAASMGPSSAVLDFRLGVCVEGTDGALYWDDKLNEKELDVICCMHLLYTGRSDQVAKVSWWPSAYVWEMPFNGYNWHHWTEWDEVWYQQRLSHIQSGDEKEGMPITQKRWRDKIRGAGAWRKMVKAVSIHADKMFQ